MPWQEQPENLSGAPIWRYNDNPIIGKIIPGVARIFNSAVMPYEGKFIGVFRGEQTNGIPYIYMGRSEDAIHWEFDQNKIPFVDEGGQPFMPRYAYDPRLVKLKMPIILSGVRIFMVHPSEWPEQQISKILSDWRILLYHITEMQFFSRVKSVEIM